MNNDVQMEIREFHDGTFSVMARVWTPQKKFYEHPTLINLTKEKAQEECEKFIKNMPSLHEIITTWEYIGN